MVHKANQWDACDRNLTGKRYRRPRAKIQFSTQCRLCMSAVAFRAPEEAGQQAADGSASASSQQEAGSSRKSWILREQDGFFALF
jgi:hypothetical protein